MVRICVVDDSVREGQLEVIKSHLPHDWMLVDSLENATAILTQNQDVSEDMLNAAGHSLRLIARVDVGDATVPRTDVPVVDIPHTSLIGVAEHAVTFILVLSRHLFSVSRRTAQEKWVSGRDEPILTDQRRYTYNWIGLDDFGTLYGKTVGIVGLGYIGRAVAERMLPFGVRLLYYKRHRLDPDEEKRLGVEFRARDELLKESDFVTLHHRFEKGAGGNDRDFGAREFELMKPTAYLVNTARGRLVDEDALVDALTSGQIAGAGLDVFRYEPLPSGHPLLEMALQRDDVILTPHVAGAPGDEAQVVIATELIEHVQGVL